MKNFYECGGRGFNVISCGNGKSGGSWRVNHFICEIRDITREFKVDVRHIPRGQIDLADSLAKWNVSQHFAFMGDHMPHL